MSARLSFLIGSIFVSIGSTMLITGIIKSKGEK